MTRGKSIRIWMVQLGGPLLVLGFQNLIVFGDHYINNFGFPWDFPADYYPVVAFWTTALTHGVFPEWIPFQQMGYPFALQLQSGMYYPPLWLFPLLHIPYTINAAVLTNGASFTD